MATYYETTTVYDFNWKQVVQAFWNRYPNPASTHVLTEDTIEREIRDGKLYTRRLLSKTNHLPKWGERFYNAKSVKILEDSVLDLKTRTLTTYTRNIGYKRVLKVDEKVEYREGEDGKTVAIRSAWISSQVFGFSRAIRAFGVERFKNNCQKAASGFNFVLNKMFPHHNLDSLQPKQTTDHTTTKGNTVKEAVNTTYNKVKSQASKIYDAYSVKN